MARKLRVPRCKVGIFGVMGLGIMRFLLPVGVAVLMTGCATSSPIPLGEDTYMLSNTGAWSWSSGAGLKGDLYIQADAYCRSHGRKLMPLHADSNNGSYSEFAHAEVQFRCLAEGDPNLKPPKPAPNVIIENRIIRE
jgi:hypothetical protein